MIEDETQKVLARKNSQIHLLKFEAEGLEKKIHDLTLKLQETTRVAHDYEWAYKLTEGVLEENQAFKGVNERWPDQTPIKAVKLAKVLKAELERIKNRPDPKWQEQFFAWLSTGCKTVSRNPMNGLIKLRDEARAIEIEVMSIEGLIGSLWWKDFSRNNNHTNQK